MYTINNRTPDNHLARVKESFLKADQALIVSPFLSADMSFFSFDELVHLRKLTLVTRLKPYTLDQYDKVDFLLDLFAFGSKHDIEIEVMIDNFLHGKVYVGIKDGLFQEAIITSANFNHHGLVINNEWGVSLEDEAEIALMVKEIYRNVFLEQLDEMKLLEFTKLLGQNPRPKRPKEMGLNLVKHLAVLPNPLHIAGKTTYWLKPIGVTGNPVRWGESFGQKEYPMHFHENPAGVRIGHIIIAYAVGHNNILSVYEVTSQTMNTGIANDRWPFYVMGKNLTPHYGHEWYQHNFTNRDQRNEAITLGKFSVTPSGKDSYGRLNHGGDKLRITPEFANYVIDKLMVINQQISERSRQEAD
ncbi:restriction endonuclease PLD domain-containing protein [Pedobacter panaciterrae]|uniref:Restriction endonuclease PLD domain-containing protein n=1 Tax=Pedobacter panaciterrae TaxID=363849 RepID=A0ABU8NHG0_9SPHI